MANLRVVRLSVKTSTQIEIQFTARLDPNIGIDNIDVDGAYTGVSLLTIISVAASGSVLTINVRPMVPKAYYKLTLQSTLTQPIQGARGERFLEDGATNIIFFTGQNEENELRDNIINDISEIYNIDPGTLIYDAITGSADELQKSLYATGEVGNANYISIEVVDEELTRGSGPFDRFSQESTFQLLRVGTTPTGTTDQDSFYYAEFPSDPVSLQQILKSDEVVSNTSNDSNSFNGLVVDMASSPVIIVTEIILIRGAQEYTYDIEQYKYGLLENKYDSSNAYLALDIENNQIKLSNSAVGPTFPFPEGSDSFRITYYYKREGRIINPDTVEITANVDVIREQIPAVATTFFLDHAPIVNSSGIIPSTGGVTWLDPEKNFDPTFDHPAFVTEIQYNEASLPSIPGQYSVNYNTGRVFVFGEDGTGNDGTTTVPPVATYKFRQTFQDGLDYNFFSDLNEVASLPNRDLRGNEATAWFDYEDTFADGTDFAFNSHIEIVNERVENRLIENIGLITLNPSVNEVGRIFNETTGEIYTTTRISNDEVYFTSSNPPEIIQVEREAARFENVIQSQIVVTDRISITGKSFIAFKIELTDTDIGSASENFIGASFNSSLSFSDINIFTNEYFYDPEDSLSVNLLRLQQITDYMVDYETGSIYVAISSGASTELGDATYKHAVIYTRNKHIIRVDNIYRSTSVTLPATQTYGVGTISDQTILIPSLELAGIRTVDDADGDPQPLVVLSDQVQISRNIYRLNHLYQITDLQVTYDPIDFGVGATLSYPVGDSFAYVNLDTDGVSITDTNYGSGIIVQAAGSREFIIAERINSLHTSSLAQLKSAQSAVDIGTNVDYFAMGADGYVDNVTNRIYLPTGAAAVGKYVNAEYRVSLRGGAAVLTDYVNGDMFVDYAYSKDEVLVSYEYGDNVIDWSISDELSEGETYYVTYRYGALRNSLRDNFGVLSGIEELSTIPDDLDRETYRDAVQGALQSFPKGPTIPSIKQLVSSMTQIDPNIIESAFLEWILGRNFLHLTEMELDASSDDELPTFEPGKFGDGLFLNADDQTAKIPANSNIRFGGGTWEAFIVPEWDGIDNDASLTLDTLFNGVRNINTVFIGSNSVNPAAIPFTLSTEMGAVFGIPNKLHTHVGTFIWYDSGDRKCWRLRVRAPIAETDTNFSGEIDTTGEFYDVRVPTTSDGYDGYDGYSINEATDDIRSSDSNVKYSFVIDAYDSYNTAFDSYDSYGPGISAGLDGIDLKSDKVHYLFDTGVNESYCRMSLYKDGKGFLRFKIRDGNRRQKVLSANIQDWQRTDTHHVACSWKLGSIEMHDEMHLFIDGAEQSNTYRYRGFLEAPNNVVFMDEATETVLAVATAPTIGGFDLSTVVGSNIVTSASANFSTVVVGSRFIILDSTTDGQNTRTPPYVYVKVVLGQNQVSLVDGDGYDYTAVSTLSEINYSINPLSLGTVSDPSIEKIRVYSLDSYGNETELYSPNTFTPQYDFSKDGYLDFVDIYDGVWDGYSVILRSFGLMQSRCNQYVYIWPDLLTNIVDTIMPPPTYINKINIINVILRRTLVDPALFAVIATDVGGHIVGLYAPSDLDFCQPSNTVTGRRLTASLEGGNIDFPGVNTLAITGTTTDGYNQEILYWDAPGKQTTTRYFTVITDLVATFTAIDSTKIAGVFEIKEAAPINWQENDGEYAEVHLSVQQQAGTDGYGYTGGSSVIDAYSRFGAEDIGKTFNIISPASIANTYTITDVSLDPSGAVKDSNTVVLDTVWADDYGPMVWRMLSTSYGDSGFANGKITLEQVGSGGQPFLLRSCWYEIDFPTYFNVPWPETPRTLCIGSDINGLKQADAVIDEMRILDEMSLDTDRGEFVPSSGRSITTDAQIVQEMESTTQTLGLFHFDNDVTNSANFYSSWSPEYIQSENSVNTAFGQSAIFNINEALKIDNKSIFDNDEGTIEFWISPILDTYNDPTNRYYIDLSSEQTLSTTALSALIVSLPTRARSISSVTITGSDTNYYIGGSLSNNGLVITLGQPLPANVRDVTVTYVPITSQGDRFSVFKSESGFLSVLVTASDTDFQIRTPIHWKKSTWHRIFVGWDFNNTDNQDRLILMVDGVETGVIRYGTGLKYGAGHLYGSPTVWGSATAGTISARNILANIDLLDAFSTVNIGADFTGQFTALARMDNLRISSELRSITYLGGTGPGQNIGRDLLYTSNLNTAQPVISDALTRLLLDFDTDQELVEYLATLRDEATGIFDFFVEVIDTFSLIDNTLAQQLLTDLISTLKPAHTRAFVSFTK